MPIKTLTANEAEHLTKLIHCFKKSLTSQQLHRVRSNLLDETRLVGRASDKVAKILGEDWGRFLTLLYGSVDESKHARYRTCTIKHLVGLLSIVQCANCRKITLKQNQYCSRRCAAVYTQNSPDVKEKLKNSLQKNWDIHGNPAQRPGFVEQWRATTLKNGGYSVNRSGPREKIRQGSAEHFAAFGKEIAAKAQVSRDARFAVDGNPMHNPETVARAVASYKARLDSDPELHRRLSSSAKERWKNPEYAKRQFENRFKKKTLNFMGQSVVYQSESEKEAIKFFIDQGYNVSAAYDYLTPYEDPFSGEDRTYIPDFVVSKGREVFVIEVKSSYTLLEGSPSFSKCALISNLAKFRGFTDQNDVPFKLVVVWSPSNLSVITNPTLSKISKEVTKSSFGKSNRNRAGLILSWAKSGMPENPNARKKLLSKAKSADRSSLCL